MTEREIFIEALQKATIGERAAYLDAACGGDRELLNRVQELLAEHEKDGTFLLDSPPPGVAATVDNPEITESAGIVIGPYKLLEQIGEGGFGTVYMADQHVPVRRRVALKIIKLGMDTRQVVSRFKAELQALSLMDHPNIARALDAGATDSGRPYFVMELIRGVPITDYCDQNNLAVHERLDLFVQVCHAVQHAHQKGIIHRDIKPSNVLVTLNEGRPVPKVIDFGVAKAINHQLTQETLFTRFAEMIGTPLYMSPEQAEMTSLDIDTRADVYSLGVLLYELLTGSTPFDKDRLRKAAFDEIRRIIREEEPPKPSLRISTLGDTRTAVAAHRHVDPHRLGKLVRGDLDWIVMKALEKDRTRRYETANGFAMDLQRYLADEPVEACPPSANYKFRKFARRNRVALGTVLAISLALIAGTAISTWQAIRAHQAQERARTAEELALSRLAAEQEAHREAEFNLKRARQAVDEYFTMVSQSKLFDVPSLQPLRKDLLEAAVRYYQTLLRDRGDDPALIADLAVAHLRLAEIYHEVDRNDDGIDALASGLDLVERLRREYPDAKQEHQRVAGFWKGIRTQSAITEMPKNPAKAERTLRRFVDLWEVLAQEHPSVVAFENDLAAAYSNLASWQAAAAGPSKSGDLARAGVDFAYKAVTIWERLSRSRPEISEYRENLVMVLGSLTSQLNDAGRQEEAQAVADRALELAEELVTQFPKVPQYRLYLAGTLKARGHRLAAAGRVREAAAAYHREFELAKGLVTEFPTIFPYVTLMSASFKDFCRCSKEIGSHDAVKLLRQELTAILAILTKRVTEFPDKPRYRQDLAQAYYDIGDGFAEIGEPTQAESAYHQCIELLRRLIIEVPSEKGYRWRWGHACRSWAFVLRSMPNRSEDARHALEDAEKTFADLSAQSPKNTDYMNFLADTSFQLGDVLEATGKKSEALDKYRKSLELRERLCTRFPNEREGRIVLGELLWRLGTASEQAGQIAEAVQLRRRALTVFEKLVADFPAISHYQWQLGNCRDGLAGLLAANHRDAEAETQYHEALALWEKLVAESPRNEDDRYHLGQTLRRRGDVLVALKRNQEAEQAFQRSLEVFRALAADRPSIRNLHGEHLFSNWKLGWFLKDSGRPQEAVEPLRRALEISVKTAVDFPKDGVAQADLSRSYFELIEVLLPLSKHAEAAKLAVDSARVFPDKWDESQRAVAWLERCVDLAAKDNKLSSDDRKSATEEYSKQSAAIVIDACKRGVANPQSADEMAWKLATRPEIALRSPNVAVELATQAVGLTPKNGDFWKTLGVAQYRAGNWKAAEATLRKSMQLRSGGDGFDWFFLGMASWQLGHKDEARKWCEKAVEWTEKNRSHDELLQRFRTEAAELLGTNQTPVPTPGQKEEKPKR